jgi:uncharacterized membrane protein (DUF106 family)
MLVTLSILVYTSLLASILTYRITTARIMKEQRQRVRWSLRIRVLEEQWQGSQEQLKKLQEQNQELQTKMSQLQMKLR